MRRIALVALLAALACGQTTQTEPGPTGTFYYPTGVAVASGRLLVTSSNFDLRYDGETGGALTSVEPEAGDALRGGINIRSFAGELAVAGPAASEGGCPGLAETYALVPVRGSNLLYRVTVGPDGSLACGDGCELALSGVSFVDPFVVGTACGPGVSRAYVGYLRSSSGQAGITQVDALASTTPELRHRSFGAGVVHDFAYQADRKRLWVVGGSGGFGGPLLWVDLLDGCVFDANPATDPSGCRSGTASAPLPAGLDFRSIALANDDTPPRRAYVTARRFDPAVAAILGSAAPDLGGVLLVVDVEEEATGDVNLTVVRSMEIGLGAGKVRVLPARPGKRDVVAALAATDGVLWIYDDETGERVAFGRDPATGAPVVGHSPFGLAVDPVPLAGGVGRVYVGSFLDSWVTPVDVPLDAPGDASIPKPGGAYRRITGGTP